MSAEVPWRKVLSGVEVPVCEQSVPVDKTIKQSNMINTVNWEAKIGYAQDSNIKDNSKPTVLAVDWIVDNLYWAETDRTGSKPRGIVMVTKTDGYRRVVVNAGLEVPTSIAVDPQLGRLFWADAGSVPKIEVEAGGNPATSRSHDRLVPGSHGLLGGHQAEHDRGHEAGRIDAEGHPDG